MTLQVEVAVAAQCRSMEGLHWDARRNLLWFVDILGQAVFCSNPETRDAGPAFNRDCSVMLHSDSRQRITYRYDMDRATGATKHRAIWRDFGEDEGIPTE